ncbi:MAG: hypothetical protein WD773_03835 [Gemmatimonadales bacterium]
MRRLLYLFAAGVVGVLGPAGLAAQERADSTPSENRERPRARSSNVLIEEDIRRFDASDAYDIVQRLRPNWLRRRGPTNPRNRASGEVTVYVDGVAFGNAAALRNIPAGNVVGITYLSAADATLRFGPRQTGAVIEVHTRIQ